MKQISLISGKGGTGKTSLTAAFASIATNAVFADCDVEAADLHLIFRPSIEASFEYFALKKVRIVQDECIRCGLCFNVCRFDAIDRIRNKYYVRVFSCEACDLCRKVCPVSAIEPINKKSGDYFISSSRFGPLVYGQLEVGVEVSGKLISYIRDSANNIAKSEKKDYIIIDGPPGIGINAIASVTGSDIVVIVVEPTQSGLHDMKRAYDLVDSYNVDSVVVINKWNVNKKLSDEIEIYCNTIGLKILKIPFNVNVTNAMYENKSIIEFDKYSDVSISIIEIWKVLSSMGN